MCFNTVTQADVPASGPDILWLRSCLVLIRKELKVLYKLLSYTLFALFSNVAGIGLVFRSALYDAVVRSLPFQKTALNVFDGPFNQLLELPVVTGHFRYTTGAITSPLGDGVLILFWNLMAWKETIPPWEEVSFEVTKTWWYCFSW